MSGIRILIALTALSSCSIVTSPDQVPTSWEDTVKEQWAITVADLLLRGVPQSKLDTIQWHHFSWKEHPGPFNCNDNNIPDNGCYRHGLGKHGSIEWNAQTPSVLHHEIGHAILHKLGYSCWKEYQHTERGCP